MPLQSLEVTTFSLLHLYASTARQTQYISLVARAEFGKMSPAFELPGSMTGDRLVSGRATFGQFFLRHRPLRLLGRQCCAER